jgi:hypothetical protein
MIVDFSCDIFSCGTRVFVYALANVMCLCVYVNMVCQRCMLYENMYSHNMVGCVDMEILMLIGFVNMCPSHDLFCS